MRVAWLLLALVLAGCAAPAASTPAPTTAAPRVAPGPTAFLDACPVNHCSEPTLAALPGRLVATVESGESIAVSTDAGRSWSRLAPPPLPSGTPPALPAPTGGNSRVTERADALVQAEGARLWFVAVVGDAQGVEIARSDDGGASWPLNVFVRGLGGVTDREWLATRGADAYLVVNQVPAGILAARSADGGKSWGLWTSVVPPAQRTLVGGAGAPIVDAQGRLLIPLYTDQQAAVSLAASADKAQTFTLERVASVEGNVDRAWPAISADGSLVAWSDGALHVARRAGGAWTPCAVPRPAAMPRAPAIVDGKVAFFSPDGGLQVATACGASQLEISKTDAQDHTDFVALASTGEGTAAVWDGGGRAMFGLIRP